MPLRKYLVCEPLVAGQAVCLGERNQMLMAVQFPRDLAVANLSKVQVLDAVEWLLRRGFPMNSIEMPIDLLPVVEIRVSQQIEAMGTNLFRAFNHCVGLLGKALTN